MEQRRGRFTCDFGAWIGNEPSNVAVANGQSYASFLCDLFRFAGTRRKCESGDSLSVESILRAIVSVDGWTEFRELCLSWFFAWRFDSPGLCSESS